MKISGEFIFSQSDTWVGFFLFFSFNLFLTSRQLSWTGTNKRKVATRSRGTWTSSFWHPTHATLMAQEIITADSSLPILEPRFERLKMYFQGLTLGDVLDLSEEMIINSAAPSDRLLMAVYLKQVVRPLRALDSDTKILKPVADTLTLRNILCSKSIHLAPLVPSDKIIDYVQSTYPVEYLQRVRTLDVAETGLVASDLPFVAQLVSTLVTCV